MKAEFVMNRSFEGREFTQSESSMLESALSDGENLNHQYYLPEIMSQRISSAINHTACMGAKPEDFFFFWSDVAWSGLLKTP